MLRRLIILRRFRNGVFHYQQDYADARFIDFQSDAEVVGWALNLGHGYAEFFSPHEQAVQVELIRDWFAPSRVGTSSNES